MLWIDAAAPPSADVWKAGKSKSRKAESRSCSGQQEVAKCSWWSDAHMRSRKDKWTVKPVEKHDIVIVYVTTAAAVTADCALNPDTCCVQLQLPFL